MPKNGSILEAISENEEAQKGDLINVKGTHSTKRTSSEKRLNKIKRMMALSNKKTKKLLDSTKNYPT